MEQPNQLAKKQPVKGQSIKGQSINSGDEGLPFSEPGPVTYGESDIFHMLSDGESKSRHVAPKQPLRSWRRRFRYFYLRFIRMQGSPEEIARGLAAGIFAGMFPLFGLQTLIGIAIATLVRGNRMMAAAGTWVSNPLTYLPIYSLNLKLGVWLLGVDGPLVPPVDLLSWEEVVSLGIEIVIALFLGCTAVGLVGASISYILGLKMIQSLRRQRRRFHRSQA